jgi:hypothetical protein
MVCHGVCVAALPESPPEIQTEHDRYEPGDTLRANCTSPPSKPAASLSFFLNNIPVSSLFFKDHKISLCGIICLFLLNLHSTRNSKLETIVFNTSRSSKDVYSRKN